MSGSTQNPPRGARNMPKRQAQSVNSPRASQLAHMAKFSSTVALLAIAFVFDASQHVWTTEWGSSYGGTTATTTTGFIPADRSFAWNPGLLSKGGIPSRTQTCATLSPGD